MTYVFLSPALNTGDRLVTVNGELCVQRFGYAACEPLPRCYLRPLEPVYDPPKKHPYAPPKASPARVPVSLRPRQRVFVPRVCEQRRKSLLRGKYGP